MAIPAATAHELHATIFKKYGEILTAAQTEKVAQSLNTTMRTLETFGLKPNYSKTYFTTQIVSAYMKSQTR